MPSRWWVLYVCVSSCQLYAGRPIWILARLWKRILCQLQFEARLSTWSVGNYRLDAKKEQFQTFAWITPSAIYPCMHRASITTRQPVCTTCFTSTIQQVNNGVCSSLCLLCVFASWEDMTILRGLLAQLQLNTALKREESERSMLEINMKMETNR